MTEANTVNTRFLSRVYGFNTEGRAVTLRSGVLEHAEASGKAQHFVSLQVAEQTPMLFTVHQASTLILQLQTLCSHAERFNKE